MHSLELFEANTKSYQIKTLSSKKLITLSKKAQFIWGNSDIRFDQK